MNRRQFLSGLGLLGLTSCHNYEDDMNWFHALCASGQSELPDYTTNILDEWVPHRGATVNSLATIVQTWRGVINNTLANSSGSPFPSSGKYTLSGTSYFNMGNTVALGWQGNLSIFLRIPSCTTLTQTQEIFWTSTGGDDVRLYAKGSTGRIGIYVINTIYQHASVSWPQDNLEHSVGFVVDFAGGTCKYFLDGVLTATISFPAATGINYTTTTGSPTFGRFSSTVYLSQTFDKVRVYKEAVEDANAELITEAGSKFVEETISDSTPVRFYVFGGESIMRGHTSVASDYPAYLQAEIANALGYVTFGNGFETTLLGTRPVTYCGPFVKTVYDLVTIYPTKDIRYTVFGATSSTLDTFNTPTNNWLSTDTDNNYVDLLQKFTAALTVLVDIELRTIESIEFVMAQGINDCDDLTRANNYETNLTAEIPDIENDFSKGAILCTKVIWAGPHDRLPIGSHPYSTTVRTALTDVEGAEPLLTVILPDNPTTYPLSGDSIHYTPTGTLNLGTAFSNLL